MGDQFKLDGDGNCTACGNLSVQGEHVQCYSCNEYFHAVCEGAAGDDKVATKTTITQLLLASTKKNFKFYCNSCLTAMEISKSESESKRIVILENKLTGIDKQHNEIKSMMNTTKKSNPEVVNVENSLPKDNIWLDETRLATVKAPEPKAVLVINKEIDQVKDIENQEIVEKVVIESGICLKQSIKDKDGNIVLVCESKEARDELKNLVQTADENIRMISPKEKLVPITLVGLPRQLDAEEVVKMLCTQNEFIKTFTIKNDITEHIKLHAIQPLRNKPTVFQVFAAVSPVLRDGLRKNKDKVVIGLTTCKVYDRKLTKRCYNCQNYGHFVKNCPSPTVAHCGKCSGTHRTDHCTSDERKCINCLRNNLNSDHSAFFHKCPSLVRYEEEQAKIKSLNSQTNTPGVVT